jgi:hypothetical protein
VTDWFLLPLLKFDQPSPTSLRRLVCFLPPACFLRRPPPPRPVPPHPLWYAPLAIFSWKQVVKGLISVWISRHRTVDGGRGAEISRLSLSLEREREKDGRTAFLGQTDVRDSSRREQLITCISLKSCQICACFCPLCPNTSCHGLTSTNHLTC